MQDRIVGSGCLLVKGFAQVSSVQLGALHNLQPEIPQQCAGTQR